MSFNELVSAKPGATARGRRVARLLALGVLLAGLLAMHALGHSAGHSADRASGLLSGALSVAGTPTHPSHAGHAAVDADAAAAALPTASLPAPPDDLNLVVFCVAVLTVAGLILVLAAVAAARDEQRLGSSSWLGAAPARPPPVRAPSLSHLSILRI